MLCVNCKIERSESWFMSSSWCLLCQVNEERELDAVQRLACFGVQSEQHPVCSKCNQKKQLHLFSRTQTGLSIYCKVCENILAYRDNIEKEAEKKVVERRQQLESIPIRGYERNKRERYTIKCTRCKEKRNPEVVKVVSAICEHCWLPHEKAAALEQHEHWNRTFKNGIQK